MNKVNCRKEKSAFAANDGAKDRSCAQCKGYKARTGYPTNAQRQGNNTGLPHNLKTGIESLSGIAMDDVMVHYNSSKPVRLNALAYAQGNEIHLGRGQEKHLPHEAWHVVQQKQGRVQPTVQTKRVQINNDQGLEKEADVFGTKAFMAGKALTTQPLLGAAHQQNPGAEGPNLLSKSAQPASIIQGKWDDVLLSHATMKQEKMGKFRTGNVKILGKSLQAIIKEFIKALHDKNEKKAKDSLIALKARLEADSNSTVKIPKKMDKKNWDENLAGQQATTFYQKWISVTEEHLAHTEVEEFWLSDFRNAYLNIDDFANAQTPRDTFLDNVKALADISKTELEVMPALWDTANQAMQSRITAVLSGSPKLKKVDKVEYFLEAISPIHVGYDKVRNIFNFWAQGVLYHNWTKPYADWMPDQVDNPQHGQKRIVDYYDANARLQFQLTMNGKKVFKADGHPLVGDSIYVLSATKIFYGTADKGGETSVHHTSFLQGEPVICAGHLLTDNTGKLQKINDSSGHYAPSKANLKRAVNVLKSQMDTSDVIVGGYASQGGVTVDQFLKS